MFTTESIMYDKKLMSSRTIQDPNQNSRFDRVGIKTYFWPDLLFQTARGGHDLVRIEIE